MKPLRSSSLPVAVLLALALVPIWGCPGPTQAPDADEEPPVPGQQQLSLAALQQQFVTAMCDTDPAIQNDEAITQFSQGRMPREWPAISAPHLSNSQVHDCQALIQGDAFGPRVALRVNVDRIEQGPDPDGWVVADVVNFSTQPYSPLGIPTGLSCLWLQGDPSGDPATWVAAIRQPGSGENCATASFTVAPANPLSLERLQIQQGPADYPSTGRWMWDEANNTQYIGIRCGDGWCELGNPQAFSPNTAIDRSEDVPGWYDEQYLAIADRATGDLVPSGLWGRIEPGPDNARVETTQPSDADYQAHVADVRITGSDRHAASVYKRKFGFRVDRTEPMRLRGTSGPQGREFQMRRPRPWYWPWGGWKPVMNQSQHTHSGSGTVRWAWSEEDDGLWVPCDAGCCYARKLD